MVTLTLYLLESRIAYKKFKEMAVEKSFQNMLISLKRYVPILIVLQQDWQQNCWYIWKTTISRLISYAANSTII